MTKIDKQGLIPFFIRGVAVMLFIICQGCPAPVPIVYDTVSGLAHFTSTNNPVPAHVKLIALYMDTTPVTNVTDLGDIPDTPAEFSLQFDFGTLQTPQDGDVIHLMMWIDVDSDDTIDTAEIPVYAAPQDGGGCLVFGTSTVAALVYAGLNWYILKDNTIVPFYGWEKKDALIKSLDDL